MPAQKIGGRISTAKIEPQGGSKLKVAKTATPAMARKLEKQQSVMELVPVENSRQKAKTGGGKDVNREDGILKELSSGQIAGIELNLSGHEPGGRHRDRPVSGRQEGAAWNRYNVEEGQNNIDEEEREDEERVNEEDARFPRTPTKYEDYYQISEQEDDEFGKAPKSFKGKLKYYVRKMGCGTSQVTSLEEAMPVVVFGATGTVGGAVARALLKDHRFYVRAVTRTPTTDQARALAELGAVVVPADLNDTRSLMRVMEGAAGVFLTTNYWEHLSKQKEITHGMNAIDAAVSSNVHHFIFHGSEPARRDEKSCGYMDAKAALEEYVKETQLPYTAVRFPFLYENLLSLFKPHLIRPGIFTLPIPMDDKSMDCMALQDAARCVVNIFLRPRNHMMKTVSLTGERMTVNHMAQVMNKHFDDRKIVYHKISPSDYASFDFQGCQDLAVLFENIQAAAQRDPRITRRIYGTLTTLDRWTHDHKEQLINAMKGQGSETPPSTSPRSQKR